MAPTVPSAKLTLSCPLFAADFNPRDPGFLLVAGGGGESRTGVGNKITLLNTSKRHEISEVVDIELSRDEDSVTSLATAHASEDSLIALAGINSSIAEQKRDNNQHLRSFKIDYPPRRRISETESNEEEPTTEKPSSGKTTPLSRTSLFRTKGANKSGNGDTYQRTLRLSPWKGADSPRVAAIATGLAPSGEIVFFNAVSTPSASDVIGRIRLNSDEEAEDVDITDLETKGKFQVAYTNGVDVFTCQISSKSKSNASPEVTRVFTTPLPEKGPRTRPKFRVLRFLSPTTLLLLRNAPDRKGCELVLLDLRQTTSQQKPSAIIIRQKKLRKTMKLGMSLDICKLGTNPEDQEQVAIAVSGGDQSIELLTIETNASTGSYGKIRNHISLRDVHPFSMTKMCFSPFTPPAHPVTPETPPQYIKLASVSLGNTVVVHTFPLAPSPPSRRTPRYVLVTPSDLDVWSSLSSAISALFAIFAVCFLLQAFTEIRGVMPPYLGASEWLPLNIRDSIARPYQTPPPHPLAVPSATETLSSLSSSSSPSTIPSDEPLLYQKSLHDLLQDKSSAEESSDTILVRWNPVANEVLIVETSDPASQPPSEDGTLHRWEDLSELDQVDWRQRLAESGHWPAEGDETVLHGVFFGVAAVV